jgi:DNA-binding CsgD family transcriptional regulator
MGTLVGRDDALVRLRAGLAAGGPVLVRGEPGIGKTRLVSEVPALVPPGTAVLVGRCDPDPGSPPLRPWRLALAGRPERAALDALDAPAPGTTDPAAATLLHRAARTRAFDAVLDGLATTGPVAVVLEDLHWADESTLHLLTQAADRVTVVVTFRDTEPGRALRAAVTGLRRHDGAVEIALRPWNAADVTALLPRDVHAGWGPVLHEAGGGVPLLVTALLRAVVDDGLAARPPAPDRPLAVPDQLADLTAERLERLDPHARLAAEIAAVAGTGCGAAHVGLLAGLDGPSALAALERAAAGGLLVATPDPARPATWEPAHALLRDAVYAQVPPATRVARHAALADAIDAGQVPGEAVTHRVRAAVDPAGCAAAVDACRAAAAAAAAALAWDRAVALLDTALGLPGCHDRAGLELDAAEAEFAAGRAEAAVRRCRRVAAASTDPDELVRAALTVRGIGGPLNVDLVLLCDVALRALPADDLAGRARVLAQRALAEAENEGSHGIDAPSREALELAQRSGSPAAVADALRARQHACSFPTGVHERRDLAGRMIELAAAGGPPDAELWGRCWRLDAALQLGDLEMLETELVRLAALASRLGWPIAEWHHHRMTAARNLLTGRFAEAEAAADAALATARRTEDVSAIGIDGAFRTELLQLQGRHGELRELMDRTHRHVPVPGMPIVTAQFGLLRLEFGERDEAQRLYEVLRPQLPSLAEDGRWIAVVSPAAQLAAALGDTTTAAWCAERLAPLTDFYLAGGSGSVRCDGAVARVAGIVTAALGRIDQATALLEHAIALDDRIGALPYRTRSELALAELLAGTDRLRATALARAAAATSRRLGMAPSLARADALLSRLRAEQDAAVPLTAREREVLAALARGRTNKQIAAELVLSERTVESHVTHILGKLGAANRAEAAAWATRHLDPTS